VTDQAPPIDVEEFRASMRESGIEEIVMPMLQLFQQEVPKGLAALTSAMQAGDLEGASRAAHSLKSSAGNVRAKALAEVLQALEHAAAEKNADESARLFESAKAACDAVLAQLAELEPGA
jgi:HPt (histidine-containing phosphotransfer) domain-containing protein